jgi:uncharacterized protein YndB with AHSA1/START domain
MIVEKSVVIDRPLDEVWAIFDDADLQTEWNSDLLDYEPVSGEGNAKGAVSTLTFKRGDGETVLTATVLERKPPHEISAVYEGMQLPFYLSSTFSAVDDDSTEWHAEIEVKLNLMQKALGPLLKGTMSDMAEKMGNDFKAYCESR